MPFDQTQPRYLSNYNFLLGSNGALGVPVGTSNQRPTNVNYGALRYNTNTSALEYWNGVDWSTVRTPGTATIVKDTDTGDGSTTAFAMLSTAPADENNILVFINNIFQEPDSAYTVSGTTITFTSAPPNSHVIVALGGFDTV